MNLSIDIGNTFIKLGLYDGGQMVDYIKIKDHDDPELADFLSSSNIEKTQVSSVRKQTKELLNTFSLKSAVSIVSHTSNMPIRLEYDTPHTLGIDRITACLGALSHFPDQHCLVIDLGTCMTLDILTADKVFKGGNISPGWKMRLDAMDQMTSKLPLGQLKKHKEILATSTAMALENGAFYGILFELRGYISLMRDKYPELKVIFTGGAANDFAEFIETEIFVLPFLILDGLNYLNENYS